MASSFLLLVFSSLFTGLLSFKSDILSYPECIKLKEVCPNLSLFSSDDLDVLECLNSLEKDSPNEKNLNERCLARAWNLASELIKYQRLRNLLEPYCHNELETIECRNMQKPGGLIKCFNDKATEVKSLECSNFIARISFLTFTQPVVLSLYIEECKDDSKKYGCYSKNQAEELACLQKQLLKLNKPCRSQVFHLSELQGENIKFDKPLFDKCSEERQEFCKGTQLGVGQIYECLLQHKGEPGMSNKCTEELLRHEQLIAQDYQVSRGLVRACREDIRKNKCRKAVSEDRDIKLAQILLCLENATHYGEKTIDLKCKQEMIAHRRMLFEDFRLSPELVNQCSKDISKNCRIETGGKTIHCLMAHARARKKDRISKQCMVELELLVKEIDIGEDWRVDPVIWKACDKVAEVTCKEVQDGAEVMNCLLDKLGTEYMTPECDTSLRQVQYFLARDIKLDPILYKACHEPAEKYCNIKKVWAFPLGLVQKNQNILVLPCLYSLSDKLKPPCLHELKRVMRQRALNVDLHPTVELVCLSDLALYCTDKTAKGEEILCLQDNLDKLTTDCTAAINNFTEIQSEYRELNPIITLNCKEVMNELCNKNNPSWQDTLDCLINKKNDPFMKLHFKCRAAVEHQQIISLKDYHFTFKFKKACKSYVGMFCPGARDKSEVVKCLSEVIRNATLNEQKQRVPKDCHQQLRAQLLQQRENIDLNPKLKLDCELDINTYCSNIPHGNAKVIECLRSNRDNLRGVCRRRIFSLERQEFADGFTDYALINTCKTMLDKFCPNLSSSDQPLKCLKKFKYFEDFDFDCKALVVKRLGEQATDYRFDVDLETNCRADINQFCLGVNNKLHKGNKEWMKGEVIKCLKLQFRANKLSNACRGQVISVMQEAALNYKLNPLLTKVCESEIRILCSSENDDPNKIDKGEVEECLKEALSNGQIENFLCKQEVIELLNESKADINTDPVLHKACTKDLKRYCVYSGQGGGKQLNCLIEVLHANDPSQSLFWQCSKLLKERLEMYKYRLQKNVENLGELYGQVSHSPSKKYFMLIALTFVGMTFISGMFCGRVLRRYGSFLRGMNAKKK